jgi:pimeloyl-ACP methyl ester carboxylesterase
MMQARLYSRSYRPTA